MEKMISAIILVKNEEKNIVNVLKNLSWTDEQIVVDNGSTDKTFEKAKDYGATTVTISEMDFSKMRNEAAKKAKGKWLLYIDTDEEISENLKKEIQTITLTEPSESQPHAYIIKRKNYFFQILWPSEDGMIRLIYKPSLVEWFGKLHETAKIKGKVDTTKNLLIHTTHNTLEDMLSQTNDWSEIEANLRLKTNHPSIVPWRLFRVFITGFYDSYLKQGGWKVGTVGMIESIYQGFSLFITYAKLWEKQRMFK